MGLEDVPLCGELVGDGSGYVDEIVDGVVEDRQQEYLDQLEAMRRGKVMVDPPLPRAQILLKVPFLGLVGITDEPAELVGEGVGPVPLGIARKLMAGESTFLRVLTDPVTGQALPLSPQRYTLRDAEKVVLQALAGGCYFLNCSNPVVLTDIDHLQAWEHGGKSTWENLRPACAAHHRLRHFKDDKDRHGNYRRYREPYRNQIRLRGWTPKLTSDGRVGWITPSGKYRAPLYETPQLTQYPKWLKRRLNKVLNPPTSTTAASTAAGSNPDTGPTTPTP
ncbi:HNH endonuclease signature motif containing protein [Specibacter sp. AOP5-B1-6]|uniref:HNH endonuclease signature motif containing protein n=1 Tax=Specibacter sp. AOP5-B1-6 TaxID=3457653 RepID=UPI00402BC882